MGGGGYLLLVVSPPWAPEHKEPILQRVAKGLLSWDVKVTGADLTSAEKACLSVKVSAGPRNELLIQHSTETLALEVLLHPEVSTLRQCFKNMMMSGTVHKHVVHAGYAFAGSGDWILQDGVFGRKDMDGVLAQPEVQQVLKKQRRYKLHVHCAAEGAWTQPGISLNPADIADSLAGSGPLLSCLDEVLSCPPLSTLLPASSVVGNIRFRRPTLYVFPGGQGDCALFGVSGFTLLVDGGFSRRPCFWEFVRHLDRLDALLVTRFNQSNVCGLAALAQRKTIERVYPQVGYVFCNASDSQASPSDEELKKDRDELLVSVVNQGFTFLNGVKQMGLNPQPCLRNPDPLILYHKVGQGTLEMYVLSPPPDSKEVSEFFIKWSSSFESGTDQPSIPLCDAASVCALLVWRPAQKTDTITRILFSGSAPQSKIFEGLRRLDHLGVLRSRVVTTEESLSLKRPEVADKMTRASSMPPRMTTAKRVAGKPESPSRSPTRFDRSKQAKVSPASKTIEQIAKKQEEEETDKKEARRPAKKVARKIITDQGEKPTTQRVVRRAKSEGRVRDKNAETESAKPSQKLTEDQAEEKPVEKTEPRRVPAKAAPKTKGAKEVTNKRAVEAKAGSGKVSETAKPKPKPAATKPLPRDTRSPASSASSSPKHGPPKPPARSIRGGIKPSRTTAATAVVEALQKEELTKRLATEKDAKDGKLVEAVAAQVISIEKPVPAQELKDQKNVQKEVAQIAPSVQELRTEKDVLVSDDDISIQEKSDGKEKMQKERDILKETAPAPPIEVVRKKGSFIKGTVAKDEAEDDEKEPPKEDTGKVSEIGEGLKPTPLLTGVSPVMDDEKQIVSDFKPVQEEIRADAMEEAQLTAPALEKHVLEEREDEPSPEPALTLPSDSLPSLEDELLAADGKLPLQDVVLRQAIDTESRLRALSSGQRTPDSLDTPREGQEVLPSTEKDVLDAIEKHRLVVKEGGSEMRRKDSVDSIEGIVDIKRDDEDSVEVALEEGKLPKFQEVESKQEVLEQLPPKPIPVQKIVDDAEKTAIAEVSDAAEAPVEADKVLSPVTGEKKDKAHVPQSPTVVPAETVVEIVGIAEIALLPTEAKEEVTSKERIDTKPPSTTVSTVQPVSEDEKLEPDEHAQEPAPPADQDTGEVALEESTLSKFEQVEPKEEVLDTVPSKPAPVEKVIDDAEQTVIAEVVDVAKAPLEVGKAVSPVTGEEEDKAHVAQSPTAAPVETVVGIAGIAPLPTEPKEEVAPQELIVTEPPSTTVSTVQPVSKEKKPEPDEHAPEPAPSADEGTREAALKESKVSKYEEVESKEEALEKLPSKPTPVAKATDAEKIVIGEVVDAAKAPVEVGKAVSPVTGEEEDKAPVPQSPTVAPVETTVGIAEIAPVPTEAKEEVAPLEPFVTKPPSTTVSTVQPVSKEEKSEPDEHAPEPTPSADEDAGEATLEESKVSKFEEVESKEEVLEKLLSKPTPVEKVIDDAEKTAIAEVVDAAKAPVEVGKAVSPVTGEEEDKAHVPQSPTAAPVETVVGIAGIAPLPTEAKEEVAPQEPFVTKPPSTTVSTVQPVSKEEKPEPDEHAPEPAPSADEGTREAALKESKVSKYEEVESQEEVLEKLPSKPTPVETVIDDGKKTSIAEVVDVAKAPVEVGKAVSPVTGEEEDKAHVPQSPTAAPVETVVGIAGIAPLPTEAKQEVAPQEPFVTKPPSTTVSTVQPVSKEEKPEPDEHAPEPGPSAEEDTGEAALEESKVSKVEEVESKEVLEKLPSKPTPVEKVIDDAEKTAVAEVVDAAKAPVEVGKAVSPATAEEKDKAPVPQSPTVASVETTVGIAGIAPLPTKAKEEVAPQEPFVTKPPSTTVSIVQPVSKEEKPEPDEHAPEPAPSAGEDTGEAALEESKVSKFEEVESKEEVLEKLPSKPTPVEKVIDDAEKTAVAEVVDAAKAPVEVGKAVSPATAEEEDKAPVPQSPTVASVETTVGIAGIAPLPTEAKEEVAPQEPFVTKPPSTTVSIVQPVSKEEKPEPDEHAPEPAPSADEDTGEAALEESKVSKFEEVESKEEVLEKLPSKQIPVEKVIDDAEKTVVAEVVDAAKAPVEVGKAVSQVTGEKEGKAHVPQSPTAAPVETIVGIAGIAPLPAGAKEEVAPQEPFVTKPPSTTVSTVQPVSKEGKPEPDEHAPEPAPSADEDTVEAALEESKVSKFEEVESKEEVLEKLPSKPTPVEKVIDDAEKTAVAEVVDAAKAPVEVGKAVSPVTGEKEDKAHVPQSPTAAPVETVVGIARIAPLPTEAKEEVAPQEPFVTKPPSTTVSTVQPVSKQEKPEPDEHVPEPAPSAGEDTGEAALEESKVSKFEEVESKEEVLEKLLSKPTPVEKVIDDAEKTAIAEVVDAAKAPVEVGKAVSPVTGEKEDKAHVPQSPKAAPAETVVGIAGIAPLPTEAKEEVAPQEPFVTKPPSTTVSTVQPVSKEEKPEPDEHAPEPAPSADEGTREAALKESKVSKYEEVESKEEVLEKLPSKPTPVEKVIDDEEKTAIAEVVDAAKTAVEVGKAVSPVGGEGQDKASVPQSPTVAPVETTVGIATIAPLPTEAKEEVPSQEPIVTKLPITTVSTLQPVRTKEKPERDEHAPEPAPSANEGTREAALEESKVSKYEEVESKEEVLDKLPSKPTPVEKVEKVIDDAEKIAVPELVDEAKVPVEAGKAVPPVTGEEEDKAHAPQSPTVAPLETAVGIAEIAPVPTEGKEEVASQEPIDTKPPSTTISTLQPVTKKEKPEPDEHAPALALPVAEDTGEVALEESKLSKFEEVESKEEPLEKLPSKPTPIEKVIDDAEKTAIAEVVDAAKVLAEAGKAVSPVTGEEEDKAPVPQGPTVASVETTVGIAEIAPLPTEAKEEVAPREPFVTKPPSTTLSTVQPVSKEEKPEPDEHAPGPAPSADEDTGEAALQERKLSKFEEVESIEVLEKLPSEPTPIEKVIDDAEKIAIAEVVDAAKAPVEVGRAVSPVTGEEKDKASVPQSPTVAPAEIVMGIAGIAPLPTEAKEGVVSQEPIHTKPPSTTVSTVQPDTEKEKPEQDEHAPEPALPAAEDTGEVELEESKLSKFQELESAPEVLEQLPSKPIPVQKIIDDGQRTAIVEDIDKAEAPVEVGKTVSSVSGEEEDKASVPQSPTAVQEETAVETVGIAETGALPPTEAKQEVTSPELVTVTKEKKPEPVERTQELAYEKDAPQTERALQVDESVTESRQEPLKDISQDLPQQGAGEAPVTAEAELQQSALDVSTKDEPDEPTKKKSAKEVPTGEPVVGLETTSTAKPDAIQGADEKALGDITKEIEQERRVVETPKEQIAEEIPLKTEGERTGKTVVAITRGATEPSKLLEQKERPSAEEPVSPTTPSVGDAKEEICDREREEISPLQKVVAIETEKVIEVVEEIRGDATKDVVARHAEATRLDLSADMRSERSKAPTLIKETKMKELEIPVAESDLGKPADAEDTSGTVLEGTQKDDAHKVLSEVPISSDERLAEPPAAETTLEELEVAAEEPVETRVSVEGKHPEHDATVAEHPSPTVAHLADGISPLEGDKSHGQEAVFGEQLPAAADGKTVEPEHPPTGDLGELYAGRPKESVEGVVSHAHVERFEADVGTQGVPKVTDVLVSAEETEQPTEVKDVRLPEKEPRREGDAVPQIRREPASHKDTMPSGTPLGDKDVVPKTQQSHEAIPARDQQLADELLSLTRKSSKPQLEDEIIDDLKLAVGAIVPDDAQTERDTSKEEIIERGSAVELESVRPESLHKDTGEVIGTAKSTADQFKELEALPAAPTEEPSVTEETVFAYTQEVIGIPAPLREKGRILTPAEERSEQELLADLTEQLISEQLAESIVSDELKRHEILEETPFEKEEPGVDHMRDVLYKSTPLQRPTDLAELVEIGGRAEICTAEEIEQEELLSPSDDVPPSIEELKEVLRGEHATKKLVARAEKVEVSVEPLAVKAAKEHEADDLLTEERDVSRELGGGIETQAEYQRKTEQDVPTASEGEARTEDTDKHLEPLVGKQIGSTAAEQDVLKEPVGSFPAEEVRRAREDEEGREIPSLLAEIETLKPSTTSYEEHPTTGDFSSTPDTTEIIRDEIPKEKAAAQASLEMPHEAAREPEPGDTPKAATAPLLPSEDTPTQEPADKQVESLDGMKEPSKGHAATHKKIEPRGSDQKVPIEAEHEEVKSTASVDGSTFTRTQAVAEKALEEGTAMHAETDEKKASPATAAKEKAPESEITTLAEQTKASTDSVATAIARVDDGAQRKAVDGVQDSAVVSSQRASPDADVVGSKKDVSADEEPQLKHTAEKDLSAEKREDEQTTKGTKVLHSGTPEDERHQELLHDDVQKTGDEERLAGEAAISHLPEKPLTESTEEYHPVHVDGIASSTALDSSSPDTEQQELLVCPTEQPITGQLKEPIAKKAPEDESVLDEAVAPNHLEKKADGQEKDDVVEKAPADVPREAKDKETEVPKAQEKSKSAEGEQTLTSSLQTQLPIEGPTSLREKALDEVVLKAQKEPEESKSSLLEGKTSPGDREPETRSDEKQLPMPEATEKQPPPEVGDKVGVAPQKEQRGTAAELVGEIPTKDHSRGVIEEPEKKTDEIEIAGKQHVAELHVDDTKEMIRELPKGLHDKQGTDVLIQDRESEEQTDQELICRSKRAEKDVSPEIAGVAEDVPRKKSVVPELPVEPLEDIDGRRVPEDEPSNEKLGEIVSSIPENGEKQHLAKQAVEDAVRKAPVEKTPQLETEAHDEALTEGKKPEREEIIDRQGQDLSHTTGKDVCSTEEPGKGDDKEPLQAREKAVPELETTPQEPEQLEMTKEETKSEGVLETARKVDDDAEAERENVEKPHISEGVPRKIGLEDVSQKETSKGDIEKPVVVKTESVPEISSAKIPQLPECVIEGKEPFEGKQRESQIMEQAEDIKQKEAEERSLLPDTRVSRDDAETAEYTKHDVPSVEKLAPLGSATETPGKTEATKAVDKIEEMTPQIAPSEKRPSVGEPVTLKEVDEPVRKAVEEKELMEAPREPLMGASRDLLEKSKPMTVQEDVRDASAATRNQEEQPLPVQKDICTEEKGTVDEQMLTESVVGKVTIDALPKIETREEPDVDKEEKAESLKATEEERGAKKTESDTTKADTAEAPDQLTSETLKTEISSAQAPVPEGRTASETVGRAVEKTHEGDVTEEKLEHDTHDRRTALGKEPTQEPAHPVMSVAATADTKEVTDELKPSDEIPRVTTTSQKSIGGSEDVRKSTLDDTVGEDEVTDETRMESPLPQMIAEKLSPTESTYSKEPSEQRVPPPKPVDGRDTLADTLSHDRVDLTTVPVDLHTDKVDFVSGTSQQYSTREKLTQDLVGTKEPEFRRDADEAVKDTLGKETELRDIVTDTSVAEEKESSSLIAPEKEKLSKPKDGSVIPGTVSGLQSQVPEAVPDTLPTDSVPRHGIRLTTITTHVHEELPQATVDIKAVVKDSHESLDGAQETEECTLEQKDGAEQLKDGKTPSGDVKRDTSEGDTRSDGLTAHSVSEGESSVATRARILEKVLPPIFAEIADEPVKDPAAPPGPTDLMATPELDVLQKKRPSIEYESSITSVSEVESGTEGKPVQDIESHVQTKQSPETTKELQQETLQPSSPDDSLPSSPVKKVAADFQRAQEKPPSRKARSSTIISQGSSEADISSEEEELPRKGSPAIFYPSTKAGFDGSASIPKSVTEQVPRSIYKDVPSEGSTERHLERFGHIAEASKEEIDNIREFVTQAEVHTKDDDDAPKMTGSPYEPAVIRDTSSTTETHTAEVHVREPLPGDTVYFDVTFVQEIRKEQADTSRRQVTVSKTEKHDETSPLRVSTGKDPLLDSSTEGADTEEPATKKEPTMDETVASSGRGPTTCLTDMPTTEDKKGDVLVSQPRTERIGEVVEITSEICTELSTTHAVAAERMSDHGRTSPVITRPPAQVQDTQDTSKSVEAVPLVSASTPSASDAEQLAEYTRHLDTAQDDRLSIDSSYSVTSEERSYTELERPSIRGSDTLVDPSVLSAMSAEHFAARKPADIKDEFSEAGLPLHGGHSHDIAAGLAAALRTELSCVIGASDIVEDTPVAEVLSNVEARSGDEPAGSHTGHAPVLFDEPMMVHFDVCIEQVVDPLTRRILADSGSRREQVISREPSEGSTQATETVKSGDDNELELSFKKAVRHEQSDEATFLETPVASESRGALPSSVLQNHEKVDDLEVHTGEGLPQAKHDAHAYDGSRKEKMPPESETVSTIASGLASSLATELLCMVPSGALEEGISSIVARTDSHDDGTRDGSCHTAERTETVPEISFSEHKGADVKDEHRPATILDVQEPHDVVDSTMKTSTYETQSPPVDAKEHAVQRTKELGYPDDDTSSEGKQAPIVSHDYKKTAKETHDTSEFLSEVVKEPHIAYALASGLATELLCVAPESISIQEDISDVVARTYPRDETGSCDSDIKVTHASDPMAQATDLTSTLPGALTHREELDSGSQRIVDTTEPSAQVEPAGEMLRRKTSSPTPDLAESTTDISEQTPGSLAVQDKKGMGDRSSTSESPVQSSDHVPQSSPNVVAEIDEQLHVVMALAPEQTTEIVHIVSSDSTHAEKKSGISDDVATSSSYPVTEEPDRSSLRGTGRPMSDTQTPRSTDDGAEHEERSSTYEELRGLPASQPSSQTDMSESARHELHGGEERHSISGIRAALPTEFVCMTIGTTEVKRKTEKDISVVAGKTSSLEETEESSTRRTVADTTLESGSQEHVEKQSMPPTRSAGVDAVRSEGEAHVKSSHHVEHTGVVLQKQLIHKHEKLAVSESVSEATTVTSGETPFSRSETHQEEDARAASQRSFQERYTVSSTQHATSDIAGRPPPDETAKDAPYSREQTGALILEQPGTSLAAGLAAGLATELICIPESAEHVQKKVAPTEKYSEHLGGRHKTIESVSDKQVTSHDVTEGEEPGSMTIVTRVYKTIRISVPSWIFSPTLRSHVVHTTYEKQPLEAMLRSSCTLSGDDVLSGENVSYSTVRHMSAVPSEMLSSEPSAPPASLPRCQEVSAAPPDRHTVYTRSSVHPFFPEGHHAVGVSTLADDFSDREQFMSDAHPRVKQHAVVTTIHHTSAIQPEEIQRMSALSEGIFADPTLARREDGQTTRYIVKTSRSSTASDEPMFQASDVSQDVREVLGVTREITSSSGGRSTRRTEVGPTVFREEYAHPPQPFEMPPADKAPPGYKTSTDETGTTYYYRISKHAEEEEFSPESLRGDDVEGVANITETSKLPGSPYRSIVVRQTVHTPKHTVQVTTYESGISEDDGHHEVVTSDDEIVRHPSPPGSREFYSHIGSAETQLPPEGSDPETILRFMAAQTEKAAKHMLSRPVYAEEEEEEDQRSDRSSSPAVEEQLYVQELRPDFAELVELSGGTTPSDPQSPRSPLDIRSRLNGEASTSMIQRSVVLEEAESHSPTRVSVVQKTVIYDIPTTGTSRSVQQRTEEELTRSIMEQAGLTESIYLEHHGEWQEVTSEEPPRGPTSTQSQSGDAEHSSKTEFREDLPEGHDAGPTRSDDRPPTNGVSTFEVQKWDKPLGLPTPPDPPSALHGRQPSVFHETSFTFGQRSQDATFHVQQDDEPLGLPTPPDSSRSNDARKTPKATVPGDVVYVDLTYVPHHGDPQYCGVEFFNRVRARYYVLSGTSPSQDVLNALLEAKRSWGEPDVAVTVIPTYETDALCYWIALNQEALEEQKIDVAPSASRCTINLQNHETSCAAYRLEF
ncbi:microtubule-associated protein futsch-like isoform X2 [Ornithodoros turicata]|uniref:microtubule-associated protein futsch-like isoform X2 n=1 Tax=Ornithodoros turicata TaxID=34597 RepID=UPI00313A166C